MLPLFQFPNIAAWRTDKLGGPVDADAAQLPGVQEHQLVGAPKGGDQITIGAEQWPECLNPITECANSSWYVWTTRVRRAAQRVGHHRRRDYEITQLVDRRADSRDRLTSSTRS